MNHYIFLIDNSYSMNPYLYKFVDMLNNFVLKIKNTSSIISVYYFSCDLDFIIKTKNVNDVSNFYVSQFTNAGSTALYDSVCKIILENGIDTKDKKYFYIITDGDDNSSHTYSRIDADKLCQNAIISGNWNIKHFDTLNYSTISVPKIKYDIDNISSLLEGLNL
jgi:hypothetical protein